MQLPGPARAVIGLAATVADEARHLPDRAIELPMLAVSSVLQLSLRAQQRYAMLTARGDAVLSGEPGDEPPAWATFDDPVDVDPSADAAAILDEIFGSPTGPAGAPRDHGTGDDDVPAPPTPITAAPSAPAKKSTAKRSTATKSTATKSTARKATKAVAKSGDSASAGGKRISKPKHTAPSKFDDVDDEQ